MNYDVGAQLSGLNCLSWLVGNTGALLLTMLHLSSRADHTLELSKSDFLGSTEREKLQVEAGNALIHQEIETEAVLARMLQEVEQGNAMELHRCFLRLIVFGATSLACSFYCT